MKGNYLVLAGALLATGCSASAQPASVAQSPAPAPMAPPAPATNPHIVMLRLYVSDIARGEKFYQDVFGANVIQKMGDNVRLMMFPGGAPPGIILIQSPDEVQMNGSFVIQVPDLQDTLDRAAANGGALKNTRFEQEMAGMPARSSHFSDPDGNLIEVLQIGGQPK